VFNIYITDLANWTGGFLEELVGFFTNLTPGMMIFLAFVTVSVLVTIILKLLVKIIKNRGSPT